MSAARSVWPRWWRNGAGTPGFRRRTWEGSVTSSERDLRDVDGAAFVAGLQAELGKLHTAGGGEQPEAVIAAGDDVAQELLPLQLEAVVQLGVGRDFLPLAAERF